MIIKSTSKSIFQRWSLLLILLSPQITAWITLPELRELASRLKWTECLKIFSDDIDPSMMNMETSNMRNGRECYKRLVSWSVRLGFSQEKLTLLLKYRLNEIGRKDLSRWLTEHKSASRKTIRNADAPDHPKIRMAKIKETNRQFTKRKRKCVSSKMDDSFANEKLLFSLQDPKSELGERLDKVLKLNVEHTTWADSNEYVEEHESLKYPYIYDGDESATQESVMHKKSEGNALNDLKVGKTSNHTNGKDAHSIRISLHLTAIIVILTAILTCCCTIFLRNKLTKIAQVFCKKKKKQKSKLIPVDDMDRLTPTPRRRSLLAKKPTRKKGRRAPSYEIVQPLAQATQTNEPAAPSPEIQHSSLEPEGSTPTNCCKCYKKRRKKHTKKTKK